jgi:hypothetical protein
MKKAILALCAALIFLAAVFLVKHYHERAARGPQFAFDDMVIDDVILLRIDYLGQTVTLEKSGGAWVTSGDEFPADTARLRRVLGHLLALQHREVVARGTAGPDDQSNLAEFGLDSAAARHVEWGLHDGRTYKVMLGKVSGIDFGSSFWKPSDEPVAYRTPGTFVFEVSSRPHDWKDTNLFARFHPDEIQMVAVTWRGSGNESYQYALHRSVDSTGYTSFLLSTPSGGETLAARDAAARIFTHAAQFKIDGFVPGVDSAASRAALDNPVMTIRITLKSGVEHLVEAGAPVDGLYRFIRHPTHNHPVRVFGWRFEYFRKKGEDLVGVGL